ncbi:GNAT family N-acetyltransferase [Paenibacillus tuaregi]|uniref:GNAT family N-acetyltransferase n=1 Tax=Paenibacillus tuaregi TaxID=1816681 RepID=UPI000837C5BF|nr:GNAT family N-acetyltransferase [Paenibacillus tuaregi]
MELLLLADPDEQMVQSYIHKSSVYTLVVDQQILGVCVLLPRSPEEAEIVNIAVHEQAQGRGFGKKLLQHTIDSARKAGYRLLKVGTGNSSLNQLAFYQKNGFRITGVERDYFVKHYSEPIMENGIACKDMILMEMELG